jgi:hypothetical protein
VATCGLSDLALAVWPAVGQAPNGVPTTKGAFGKELKPGQRTSFVVDDHALVRPFVFFFTRILLTFPVGRSCLGPHRLRRQGRQLQDWRLQGRCVPCSPGSTLPLILFLGLVCTDGGITSGVLLAEYGFGNFGQFGGLQTAWDLSLVDAQLNLDTRLTSSDGKTVACTKASCPPAQVFNNPTDFQANRNSPLGIKYTHTFCP